MHQLHRDRTHHDLVGHRDHRGQRGGGGGEGEGGPHPLAAGGDQVTGDLGEEGILGDDRATQCVLDPCQIGLEHGQLQQGG